jgi:hypothetical protein
LAKATSGLQSSQTKIFSQSVTDRLTPSRGPTAAFFSVSANPRASLSSDSMYGSWTLSKHFAIPFSKSEAAILYYLCSLCFPSASISFSYPAVSKPATSFLILSSVKTLFCWSGGQCLVSQTRSSNAITILWRSLRSLCLSEADLEPIRLPASHAIL